MSIGTIYRITNTVNGKVYIGQTSRSPQVRFRQHKDILKKCSLGKTPWDHLRKAMQKYGLDSFRFDIIFQTFNTGCLSEFEILFIKEHNSFSCGYNKTRGGEGASGYTHSDEAKSKISKRMKGEANPMYGVPTSSENKKRLSSIHKGKTLSDEHKRNLSALYSGAGNPRYGQTKSEAELVKMSANRGTPYTIFGITYRSERHAAAELNISRTKLRIAKERELQGWEKEDCLRKIYSKRKPCSAERKDKISKANGKTVTYLGVKYQSKNALARALGMTKMMLRTRIKNGTIVLE